jgi:hypothetical protein
MDSFSGLLVMEASWTPKRWNLSIFLIPEEVSLLQRTLMWAREQAPFAVDAVFDEMLRPSSLRKVMCCSPFPDPFFFPRKPLV